MSSLAKIFSRYVLSAVGIVVILLLVNFGIVLGWLVQSKNNNPVIFSVREISDGISRQNEEIFVSDSSLNKIHQAYQWAMLLDESGDVIWSENLPADVPLHYTISDVASFTRWYLNDYPVRVWQNPKGLLVLGNAKYSIWKHEINFPETIASKFLAWLSFAMILNVIAAILLALLFGFGLFRSIKRMVTGIEYLAENEDVQLPVKGVLGDLAIKINQTSLKLKNQEEVLKKRDNARTKWIAAVSHDIRTPLSLIMGYSSQLEENSTLSQKDRQQAGIIRRQSERIKSLITDLNLTSKLEYNMQPIRKNELYPVELVRTVVTDILNSGLSSNHSIELNVENDTPKIKILGDEELLRRAISNLILNSIQHNPGRLRNYDQCQEEPAVLFHHNF